MKELYLPLVSVHCMTYNHGQFIGQCLDGFVMQKTNFKFEVIVHDDASNDNTADIVREYIEKYPDIIKPIFQTENQYCKLDGSIRKIMLSHTRGKYIATCEGDDYWIDPLKLQKQVDFLENYPEYGMCYTNFNIFKQNQQRMIYDVYNSLHKQFRKEYSLDDFIYFKGFVCPPSWLFRKTIYDSFEAGIKSLDASFLRFAHFLHETKVYCISDVTTVYRMHDASVSHQKSYISIYNRRKSLLESQLFLIDKYGLSNTLRGKCISSYYRTNIHLFIIHNQLDDIEAAKREVITPSFYIKCCLFCSKNSSGRLLVVWLYSVYKLLVSIHRYFC